MNRELARTKAGLGSHDREVGSAVAKQHTHDSNRPRKNTKELRILEALETGSLNRFEALDLFDSCLNSTVAKLRERGFPILSKWETVRTRSGFDARLKRYWIPGSEVAP